MCAKRFHKLIVGQIEIDGRKYRYSMADLIQAEENLERNLAEQVRDGREGRRRRDRTYRMKIALYDIGGFD
jgi:hypothetical protein